MTQSSICLAILIKPHASIETQALFSVKPFIDNWVVCSQALDSNKKRVVRNALVGLSGQFIADDLRHYGDAKNRLIKEAQKCAEWVLLLELDESLVTLEPSLSLPKSAAVCLLDVHRGKTVRTEPRLFRHDCNINYAYPAAEQLSLEGLESAYTRSFSIHNNSDKLAWAKDNVANRFLLDAVLGQFDLNPAMSLAIGEIELASGQLELALPHFEAVVASDTNDSVRWMAHYLSGGICQANNELDVAINHWHSAFELCPTRAEPLLRMAELHYQERDYSTANLLSEQVSSMSKPQQVDYYEPDAYCVSPRLLRARALFKMGNDEQATQLLNTLLEESVSLDQSVQIKALLEQTSSQVAKNTKSDSAECVAIAKTNPPKPKLTVGMATHDDYDGVYFSIMSVILYHQEQLDQIEILVVDNNPSSKHGEAVRGLVSRVPQARYIAAQEYRGTAIRERIFQEAYGDYVLCIDCHVFLHQGVLGKLIEYFDQAPKSLDLLHGPIFYDNHDDYSTHMTPEWMSGFFGRWGSDQQGAEKTNAPFEIPMQGLGLFACVKENWPGFNLKFRGFGGEEGYIHEKVRQRGGRVLCLPFLRWSHRFDRPNAPTYVNAWSDRVRNYLIGWTELGMDVEPVLQHFSDLLGEQLISKTYSEFLVERASPLWSFDTICVHSSALFEKPILSGFGVQRRIQNTVTQQELVDFLSQAIEKKLPNLVIFKSLVDSQLEFEGSLSQVEPQLNKLFEKLTGDTVFSEGITHLTSLDNFELAIIPSNAFVKAREMIVKASDVSLLSLEGTLIDMPMIRLVKT